LNRLDEGAKGGLNGPATFLVGRQRVFVPGVVGMSMVMVVMVNPGVCGTFPTPIRSVVQQTVEIAQDGSRIYREIKREYDSCK